MAPSTQSIVGSPKTLGKKTFQSRDKGKPKTKAVIVMIAIDAKNTPTICSTIFIKLNPFI